MFSVIRQEWEEVGPWGTRKDGYSLHLTFEDAANFIREYWKKSKDSEECFERPAGEPKPTAVNSNRFMEIRKAKLGLRVYDE